MYSIRRSLAIACVVATGSSLHPAVAATCEFEKFTLNVIPVATASSPVVITCSEGAPSPPRLTVYAEPGPTMEQYTASDKSPVISGKFSAVKKPTDLFGVYVRDAARSADGAAIFHKGDVTLTATNVPAHVVKLYFKVLTN